jgi:SAM-dependent methyltransferase
MSRSIICPLCNKNEWTSIGEKSSYRYIRCKNCSIETTSPFPTYEEISNYYKSKSNLDSYHTRVNYPREDKVHSKIADLALKNTKKNAPLVLDIGCLDGLLLDEFKIRGAITYGIEIQNEPAQVAGKKHGERVINGSIEEFESHYPGIKFDVVTLIGVIEHVLNPVATLEFARRMIKPDGILIIQTPNTNSILHKILGVKYWPPYVPVEHVYLFSSKNINNLFYRSGFVMDNFKMHWKIIEIEFFYLQTRIFMPYLYSILKHVVPKLPNYIKKLRIPLYSGEILILASPDKGYKKYLGGKTDLWISE